MRDCETEEETVKKVLLTDQDGFVPTQLPYAYRCWPGSKDGRNLEGPERNKHGREARTSVGKKCGTLQAQGFKIFRCISSPLSPAHPIYECREIRFTQGSIFGKLGQGDSKDVDNGPGALSMLT